MLMTFLTKEVLGTKRTVVYLATDSLETSWSAPTIVHPISWTASGGRTLFLGSGWPKASRYAAAVPFSFWSGRVSQ